MPPKNSIIACRISFQYHCGFSGHQQEYFLDHYEQLLSTEQRTLVVVPPGAEEQLRFNYDSMLEAMSKNHAWLFLLHEKLDKAEKKEKSYSKMPAILLDLAGRMDSMVLSYRRGMLREHYKVSKLECDKAYNLNYCFKLQTFFSFI